MNVYKFYQGRRGAARRPIVSVDNEPLERVSAVAFDWGTPLPGTIALAQALLLSHLGVLPARSVLHRFAFLTVATWSESRWQLTTNDIEAALAIVLRQLQVTCARCADTGRREVRPRLWTACDCNARPMPPPSPAA